MNKFNIIEGKKDCKVIINKTEPLTLQEVKKLFLEIETEMCFTNYRLQKGQQGR